MSLPKYVVNFEELTDDLKKKILELIDDELRGKYAKLNTNDIEALLEDLKELLPSLQYNMLKKRIEGFIYYNHNGMQKNEGRLLDIPPIIMENKEDFIFDKNVFLTGLHFNQTGWKKEDTYTLEINKEKIIDNATIKEIGEHKYFNTFYKVHANTPISFILNNNSGNSRQTMVDLEYIEGNLMENPVELPKIPPRGDILFMLDTTGSMGRIYSEGTSFLNNLTEYLANLADKNLIYTIFFGDIHKGNLLTYDYTEVPPKKIDEFSEYVKNIDNITSIGGVNSPESGLKVLELYKNKYETNKKIRSIFIATDAEKLIGEVSGLIREIDIPIFVYIPERVAANPDNVWEELQEENKVRIIGTF